MVNFKVQSPLVIVYLVIVEYLVIVNTRKYPLRRYFLGVLTHTTALDQFWGGDETLTMWF